MTNANRFFKHSSWIDALAALGFSLLVLFSTAASAATATRNVHFDHIKTGFPLTGAHATLPCETCHVQGVFRGTPRKCQTCHNALSWKAWRFDHDKQTSFVLDGGHKGIACDACHTRPMPRKMTQSSACISCHEIDDVHNGGFGQFCEQCHVTSSFKKIRAGVGGAMSVR